MGRGDLSAEGEKKTGEGMKMEPMIGKGREAIELLADTDSFQENIVGAADFDGEYGPGAVVGTCTLNGRVATIISNDAQAMNPRFPVVYFGVIGMEEAYKMASAVYETIRADQKKPVGEKRPILLIVDTPGNGPGKVEEIIGMNKATGSYQLALAEARKSGHPVVAVVIGRAISGAFLCHGLQADHILALSEEYGTVIHVMPLSSIARITKMDIERLEEMSRTNPVFASGVNFFYRLGGIEEIIEDTAQMKEITARHVELVRDEKVAGRYDTTGPEGRGILGAERNGRVVRPAVIAKMMETYGQIRDQYI